MRDSSNICWYPCCIAQVLAGEQEIIRISWNTAPSDFATVCTCYGSLQCTMTSLNFGNLKHTTMQLAALTAKWHRCLQSIDHLSAWFVGTAYMPAPRAAADPHTLSLRGTRFPSTTLLPRISHLRSASAGQRAPLLRCTTVLLVALLPSSYFSASHNVVEQLKKRAYSLCHVSLKTRISWNLWLPQHAHYWQEMIPGVAPQVRDVLLIESIVSCHFIWILSRQ